MSRFTAKGSRLYIGGTGPLASEAAWVQIRHVQNIPEIGHVFEEIAYNTLDNGDTEYEKGARGTTQLTVEFVRDDDDNGQSDLQAAAEDLAPDVDYNFRIEWGPAPTATGATPPISTFKAKAMSFVDNIGTTSDMIRGSCVIRPKTGSIAFAETTP